MAKLLFGWAAGSYLWVFFLIFAVINFIASIYMVKYLSALKKRTKMSAAIAGAVILSMISSLPEIVSAITAGVIGSPEVSIGDIMGANLFSGAMLAIADIIFIRYLFFKKIDRSNRFLIYIMVGVNLLLLFALLPINAFNFMRASIPYLNISWVFLVLFLVYLVFLIAVFKGFGDVEAEPKVKGDIGLKKLSLKVIIILFVVFSLILVVSSILLVTVIENFERAYGLKKESAGAIFLGMATALPETVSVFVLCRLGFGNVAIAGIMGSHFFNSIIYLISDIFHFPKGSLEAVQDGNVRNLIPLFILTIFLLINALLYFLKTFKKWNGNKIFSITTSTFIIIMYSVGVILPVVQDSYQIF